MKDLESVLEILTGQLRGTSPELDEIFEDARTGGLDEVSALARLMALMQEQPELALVIEKLAFEAFAPLRESTVEPATSTELAPVDLGPVSPGDLIFDSGTGLPKLNPLYEARLAERLQFDGDIPELRTGPLPEGGTPAVPVNTLARNPVAIGMMLEQASEEVADELKYLTAKHADVVAGLIGEAETTGTELEVAMKGTSILAPDPTGYQKGQLPSLRKVEFPGGADLALATPEQKQVAAWKAVATTQGRRSMKAALTNMVQNGLENAGYPVKVNLHKPDPMENVPVYAEWTVDIGGTETTQPSFAFVDVAAKSLTRRLETQLAECDITDPIMEVITIDTVDVRKVGWAVRIVPGT